VKRHEEWLEGMRYLDVEALKEYNREELQMVA